MKSILVVLILGYLSLCLLLFLFQRFFLYFPQSAAEDVNLPVVSFKINEVTMQGWVINPEASAAVIYYGGNAESVEHNQELLSHLLVNYAVYLIPYRGYGNNPGKPSEKMFYQDALSIYDQISQKHSDISLIGRSLGSGVATYVSDNRQVKRLVLITPYDSIEMVAKHHYPIFPVSWLITDKYPSVERAPRIEVPTMLLIAARDQVIPTERSEKLAAAIPKELLSKRVIQSATHNDITLFPEFGEYMTEFFAN